MEKHRQLIIRNDTQELNRVAVFLKALGKEWYLPEDMITSVNLVLEEALTNIIFYAYEEDSENEITIHFEKSEKHLKIELIDDGVAYDPTQKKDPDIELSVEDRPIGGLGIFMIKKIMDEFYYQRVAGKNCLTLVKGW